jgi:hypothetical protein
VKLSYKTLTMSRVDHIIASAALRALDGVVRAVDKSAGKRKR